MNINPTRNPPELNTAPYSTSNTASEGLHNSLTELKEKQDELKKCQDTFIGRVVSVLIQTDNPLLKRVHTVFINTFSSYSKIAKTQSDLTSRIKELTALTKALPQIAYDLQQSETGARQQSALKTILNTQGIFRATPSFLPQDRW